MRAMLALVTVVLVSGCSPRPCAETCQGCCDEREECRPGNTLVYCGTAGRACDTCKTNQICSPTGACASSGSGGGTGGGATGGGAGGGGAAPSVFVTLRFDTAQCCVGTCDCQNCAPLACTVTKSVEVTRFQQLRTTSLSACVVTQTSSDGFDADCTGKCTTTKPGCYVNGVGRMDTVISCTQIAGTRAASCDWAP